MITRRQLIHNLIPALSVPVAVGAMVGGQERERPETLEPEQVWQHKHLPIRRVLLSVVDEHKPWSSCECSMFVRGNYHGVRDYVSGNYLKSCHIYLGTLSDLGGSHE